jgi:hypothetical protein
LYCPLELLELVSEDLATCLAANRDDHFFMFMFKRRMFVYTILSTLYPHIHTSSHYRCKLLRTLEATETV